MRAAPGVPARQWELRVGAQKRGSPLQGRELGTVDTDMRPASASYSLGPRLGPRAPASSPPRAGPSQHHCTAVPGGSKGQAPRSTWDSACLAGLASIKGESPSSLGRLGARRLPGAQVEGAGGPVCTSTVQGEVQCEGINGDLPAYGWHSKPWHLGLTQEVTAEGRQAQPWHLTPEVTTQKYLEATETLSL